MGKLKFGVFLPFYAFQAQNIQPEQQFSLIREIVLESERLVKASGGGIIVNPFDVNLTAESISNLLSDSSTCEKMGRAAFDYVNNKLPFEDFVDTLLMVYNKILST